MAYLTTLGQGLTYVQSTLGYNADSSIPSMMSQCWSQIKARPAVAAAVMGGLSSLGYLSLGRVGLGLAVFATPLVTSPKVMSAASNVFHQASSWYYSNSIQDMGPALNKNAQDFVRSVPSEQQDIVVGHLNTLLRDMDAHEKAEFLEYLNLLSKDQKNNADTLLSALVILKVPAQEIVSFGNLIKLVGSHERIAFAYEAVRNLGVPGSVRLKCYDILRGVSENERPRFIQLANSLLDPSMPDQAQLEVILVFSTIRAPEREAYIQALNTVSSKTEVGRVQMMQQLAIPGDRLAIANNYITIITKLLSSKERNAMTIDQKLHVLEIARHPTDKKKIDVLWKKADKYFHISNLEPGSKIALFKMLAAIPEVIRIDVMKAAARLTYNAKDHARIFTAMAKLSPENAQLLKDYGLVGLFADLKKEDQETFLILMNNPAYKDKQGELVDILRNKDLRATLATMWDSFKSRHVSPERERKTSFQKKLETFKAKQQPVPNQAQNPELVPDPAQVVAQNPASLTIRRLVKLPIPANQAQAQVAANPNPAPVLNQMPPAPDDHIPPHEVAQDPPPDQLPPQEVAANLAPVQGNLPVPHPNPAPQARRQDNWFTRLFRSAPAQGRAPMPLNRDPNQAAVPAEEFQPF